MIEEEIPGALTIFSPLRINDYGPPILATDKALFSESLLPINETRNQMMMIERLGGAKDKYAGTVSNELIKDFQLATSYPPETRDYISPEELTDVVKSLSGQIQVEREKVKNKVEDDLS